MKNKYQLAAEKIQRARNPVILSGAGLSAESGIPTFRGAGGLWKTYRAEDLATPEAFSRDPDLVWDWYNMRRELILSKSPNDGHLAIAGLKKLLPHLEVITQNVDDLHQQAGLPDFIEMHGNIFTTKCVNGDYRVKERTLHEKSSVCPACGGRLRPDIVWFGEPLNRENLHKILQAVQECDVMVVVGTSGTVYPAAGYAIEVRRKEGQIIEINTDETHRPFATDIFFRESAATVLPQILSALSGLS
jgi:NAD-dependent deacetylase